MYGEILALGVVAFGFLFSVKEFFDIYFERQEMKARMDYIHKRELDREYRAIDPKFDPENDPTKKTKDL
jgi:hypothetical protein